MASSSISGKELRKLSFPQGPAVGLAIDAVQRFYKHHKKHDVLKLLQEVLEDPLHFTKDEAFSKVADALIPKPTEREGEIPLLQDPVPFNVFGAMHIEEGALAQMKQAAVLPVSVAGALMPDAHQGYGLPIGGVLATHNAVIPYGVGVDIGCRMCLSVFDIPTEELEKKQSVFSRELNANTLFGAGKEFKKIIDHPVLEHKAFEDVNMLRSLRDTAARQLGSSGSGNHFVEFGEVEIMEYDEVLKLAPGKYLGLLSHSGSRGLGANIANHYTKLAKNKRMLPKDASNLAWLGLDEQEGMEYWIAMNLAGDYASACHHVIHDKIAHSLGREPLRIVENHHNFAWKEIYEGQEVIVHRKGATPAGKDVLGIIPGSMTAPGFIVKGKGENAALSSASHGAGRRMSRTAAMKSITHDQLKHELKKHQVKLIGGGLDEAPGAYKDIEVVMKSQQQLVEVVGKFQPRIVRMDG